MSLARIVRAILHDYPATRYDVTLAHLLYLQQYAELSLPMIDLSHATDEIANPLSFVRTWQRQRKRVYRL